MLVLTYCTCRDLEERTFSNRPLVPCRTLRSSWSSSGDISSPRRRASEAPTASESLKAAEESAPAAAARAPGGRAMEGCLRPLPG
jgi:hypothetical protein